MVYLMEHLKQIVINILMLLFIYAFAGGAYLLIETFYRGYTFLEMFYLAGFLGIIAALINDEFYSYKTDYLIQTVTLTIIGTAAEWITGVLFNSEYHIWDYRGLWGSFFYGQCNVLFMIAWFGLFFILLPVIDYMEWRMFNYQPDNPPSYQIAGHVFFQFKSERKEKYYLWLM